MGTEYGNKLLRILTDFHKSQIMELDQLAQNSIMRASHIVIPEFATTIPNITELIEHEIDKLIGASSKFIRRNKNTTNKQPNKKPKLTDTPKKHRWPLFSPLKLKETVKHNRKSKQKHLKHIYKLVLRGQTAFSFGVALIN